MLFSAKVFQIAILVSFPFRSDDSATSTLTKVRSADDFRRVLTSSFKGSCSHLPGVSKKNYSSQMPSTIASTDAVN
jgi:hypothetical protein